MVVEISNPTSPKSHHPKTPEMGGEMGLYTSVDLKRKPRSFWFRNWHPLDVSRLIVTVGLHLMCLLAPFYFTWPLFLLSISLGVITGMLGITLSYHRNLTHKSFTLPKWLEYTFAYCGVQALQGDPIFWVSTHRYHHQFADTSRDPHSPNEGFWFSHFNWIFDKQYRNEKCGKATNVGDLSKQPFYRFIRNTYILHPLALGALLYIYGGMPFLVWGMGLKMLKFHAQRCPFILIEV
ncbi:unnamed protein product [Rhodiola kirilowii]